MHFQGVENRYPLSGQDLRSFVRRVNPPLNTGALSLDYTEGDRNGLRVPTTGDASLVLRYRGKEGSVLSFGVNHMGDLSILQIQGVKSKSGYRVSTSVMIPDLFAREIDELARLEPKVRRIILPNEIEGLCAAQSDLAVTRYRVIALRLGLVYSAGERSFIRDVTS